MRASWLGKRLALASAAIFLIGSASAQTVPPRPIPQVRPAPQVNAPIRPRTEQAGTVIAPIDADQDGDDFTTPADCDDHNPDVHPGADEVANTIDEDCNSTTIGILDADYDGYTSSAVSNPGLSAAATVTGLDCNDAVAGIRPDAQELPNRLDDNCDGAVDNMIGTWWTPR